MVNVAEERLRLPCGCGTVKRALPEPVKEKHGMAIYVVKGHDGKPTFVKNKNYIDQPMMRKMIIGDKLFSNFGLVPGEPMYTTAMRDPKILEFLNHPEKYAVQLSALSS